MKKYLKRLVQYPIRFVTVAGSILWPKKPDRVLVTILEKSTGKEHHLLYDADHVPCDECVIRLIGDTYGVPRRNLAVIEKRPSAREIGQCTKPGKRGTWSIRKLDKIQKA